MAIPKAKALGATLLLSGTMLGAGMLAMPLVSARMGFNFACLSLLGVWVFMTYTGLIMLEVCLAFPVGTQFDTIARNLFGRKGVLVVNGSLLLLLYSLAAAHISGAGSSYQFLLSDCFGLHFPAWIVSTLCTVIIALLVLSGTRLVDNVNRILFTLNIIVFLALTLIIDPSVHLQYLRQSPGEWHYIWSALPVFMTAFGFHGSIPTIVNYLGTENPKSIRNIFIAGGIIPLLVYGIWLFASLGVLPQEGSHSFSVLQAEGGSIGNFLAQINSFVHSKWVPILFNTFTNIAMFTSYLCIALSLYNSVASTIRQDLKSPSSRLKTILICFLPPLGVALFYPNGFVLLLGLASFFLAILAVFFPLSALFKLRHETTPPIAWKKSPYHVFFGAPIYLVIGGSGCAIVLFQILDMFHLLP